ncbi:MULTISPECIES: hypothetical protein [unclassified Streptomyces]|uniref:hypothetical protein n=1 Tax=unclassified Streptomyces TaxID=2593676 RepID=UPI000CD5013D|nr:MULTISPECIES: hypothetical protein [unclassified Streptomyces]
MIIALIAAAEVGFWLVLAAGLAARYPLRMPRLGGALLLCVPLIDLLLLSATAADLARGGEPSAAHGVAAFYLGFTVAYGHRLVRWADGHAAHRFQGAPRPAKPPRYGRARARHELALWRQTVIAVVIAAAVLQFLIAVAQDGSAAGEVLTGWQLRGLQIVAVHGLIAGSYVVWPRSAPPGGEPGEGSAATGGLRSGSG